MLHVPSIQTGYSAIALAIGICLACPLSVMAQSLPFRHESNSQPTNRQSINSPLTPSTYILGPGDQLDITVFDYSELTGSKVVLSDGTIVMPLIGAVMAAGKTPEQLAQDLTTQLQSLLINPVVTVIPTTLRSVIVTVSGEVLRPGPVRSDTIESTRDNDDTPRILTISAALSAAGGITRDADIRHIVLRRYSADGTSPTRVINLWDAIVSDNPPPDLVLQDGDAIYVPRLTEQDALDRRLTARSSFAPATVRVRVVGEVNDPGEVEVPPNSSLSSAVAIAGGPTEDARLSQVGFVRLNDDGRVEQQTVDLRNLTDNLQIQDGDVIVVPKRNTASILDFADRLLNPLDLFLDIFR